MSDHSSSNGAEPLRGRARRSPLPPRDDRPPDVEGGMDHEGLVEALRAIDGLDDLGQDTPNFHFRSRPFLHFHEHPDGIYADVRLGRGDFQPVWVSTSAERLELLALVHDHVERVNRSRKRRRDRSNRKRHR